MGYLTALGLSFNNLLTKGRALLTAFAGSVGIIGIALILSLSNRVNQYISRIQRDTMAAYPIVVESEAINLGNMMTTMRDIGHRQAEHDLDAIYVNPVSTQSTRGMSASITQNNLTAIRPIWISRITCLPHLSNITYNYEAAFTLLSQDPEGELVQAGSPGRAAFPPRALHENGRNSSAIAAFLPSDEKGLPGKP